MPRNWIFTGDRITPQQAVEFGLANRVVAPEKLMRKPVPGAKIDEQRAWRETKKKLMNLYLHRTAAEMLDTQFARQLAATVSKEHTDIASAFLAQQKRNQDKAK